jgi:hypothetical protein|tara:strand:- start:170 stop:409 length:240 start_codon:yes stop_codon:yes gene_type:complete
MKLKPPPVDLDIELLFQSDQTGSLRNIAKRSDEVGIEQHFHLLAFFGHGGTSSLKQILIPNDSRCQHHFLLSVKRADIC